MAAPTLSRTIIDGGVLEGGGQILRQSVAIAALLSKPLSIQKIRHNRKPPGLRKQHAAGITLTAEICGARLTGANVSSSSVEFTPSAKGISLPGQFEADPGTAGSTTLLLQVSLPVLLYSSDPVKTGPSTLTLRGGTNASMAPQIDYTQHIFLPFLRNHFGINPELTIQKRGYYPRGGGLVLCSVLPVKGPLPAVNLTDRGQIICITGEARMGGLPSHLASRMRDGALLALSELGYTNSSQCPISISAINESKEGTTASGGGILIWAETAGGCRIAGSAVSTKGKEAAEVGREAVKELVQNLCEGGCVDEYLQDQILIFMALAKGKNVVRTGKVTLHTQTAIWVVEQLTDAKFEVTKDEFEHSHLITCHGIGFTAPVPGPI